MVRDKIIQSLVRDYELDKNAFLVQLIALLKAAKECNYKDEVIVDYANFFDGIKEGGTDYIFQEEIALVTWEQTFLPDEEDPETQVIPTACLVVRNMIANANLRLFFFIKDEDNSWNIVPCIMDFYEDGHEYHILYGYSWYKEFLNDDDELDKEIGEGKHKQVPTPSYIYNLLVMFAELCFVARNHPELKCSVMKMKEKIDDFVIGEEERKG